jgi:hypothetical protein
MRRKWREVDSGDMEEELVAVWRFEIGGDRRR